MNSEAFLQARKKLGKTQKRLAELLGTSLKAVHSYEQGWRSVPVPVERQLFFLMSMRRGAGKEPRALLGHQEMSSRAQETMSSMGVSGWKSVLVH